MQRETAEYSMSQKTWIWGLFQGVTHSGLCTTRETKWIVHVLPQNAEKGKKKKENCCC